MALNAEKEILFLYSSYTDFLDLLARLNLLISFTSVSVIFTFFYTKDNSPKCSLCHSIFSIVKTSGKTQFQVLPVQTWAKVSVETKVL